MSSVSRRGGSGRGSATTWAALSLAAAVIGGSRGVGASWWPSIGPKEFELNDQLPLFVNELTSLKTQTKLDHYQ